MQCFCDNLPQRALVLAKPKPDFQAFLRHGHDVCGVRNSVRAVTSEFETSS